MKTIFNAFRFRNKVAILTFLARFKHSQRTAKILLASLLFALGVLPDYAAAPGNVDLSFDAGTSTGTNYTSIIHSVLVDSRGGIILGGEFTQVNGAVRDNIARLNPDGSPDPAFPARVTHQGGNAKVDVMSFQGSQILIGGEFDSVNGFARNGLARLNANGTLDTAFNPNLGFIPEVQTILLQSDGKIIVAGFAITASSGGVSRDEVVRLDSNGNLDPSFDIGLNLGGFVYTGAIQPDGKVLVGGFFNSSTGPTNIARFFPDGTLDTSYWVGLDIFGIINSMDVQGDGKAVIAGNFNNVNGITRYGYARLNSNGALDTGFELHDAGTNNFSAGGRLQTALIEPGDKIILGGTFTPFGGIPTVRVARFLPDGTPDPIFSSIITDGPFIEATTLQADGKILVAGEFNSYAGINRKNVLRLAADPPVFVGHSLTLQQPARGKITLTFIGQKGFHYALDSSLDLFSWSQDTTFYASSPWMQFPEMPASGIHCFYRIRLLQ